MYIFVVTFLILIPLTQRVMLFTWDVCMSDVIKNIEICHIFQIIMFLCLAYLIIQKSDTLHIKKTHYVPI